MLAQLSLKAHKGMRSFRSFAAAIVLCGSASGMAAPVSAQAFWGTANHAESMVRNAPVSHYIILGQATFDNANARTFEGGHMWDSINVGRVTDTLELQRTVGNVGGWRGY